VRSRLLGYCGTCGRDVAVDFCENCGAYVQPPFVAQPRRRIKLRPGLTVLLVGVPSDGIEPELGVIVGEAGPLGVWRVRAFGARADEGDNGMREVDEDQIAVPAIDRYRHIVVEPFTVPNLHELAALLGINRCWFHGSPYPHYDSPIRRATDLQSILAYVHPRVVLGICGIVQKKKKASTKMTLHRIQRKEGGAR
jgi:hypothetical protein